MLRAAGSLSRLAGRGGGTTLPGKLLWKLDPEGKQSAAAKKAGCRTANGLGMLLHQGAKAFEIWTGKPAPLDVMRRALKENVYGGAKS